MSILIDNRQDTIPIPETTIAKSARIILDDLGSPDGELSVVIVSDSQMAELNATYRHRQGPTNVIAFAMRDGEFGDLNPQLLGDVVISADTCRRESAAAGVSFTWRLVELLTHGILHLFDFDHERSEAEDDRMQDRSQALLKRLGARAADLGLVPPEPSPSTPAAP
jgi:probable rRNA maturation factor